MTDKKYIIALDQGTTSSRAVILDHDANIVSVSQREFKQIYPQAGWVEHDPMELYATQSSVLTEILAQESMSGIEKQASLSIMPLYGSAVVRLLSAKR